MFLLYIIMNIHLCNRFWGWRVWCWRFCLLMWLFPLLTGSVIICWRNVTLMTKPELSPWQVKTADTTFQAACAYKKMSKFILVFHLKQIEVKFWYIFVVLDWNDNGWRWCVPEIPAQCDCFSSRVSGPLLPWTGSLGKYSVFVRYTCIWQTSLKKITWEYASVDFCEELL